MSAKKLSFLDSNVVIYAYDSTDQHKQSIAQKTLTDGLRNESTVISTQVLGEFFFLTVNRKKILSIDEGEEALRALSAIKTQLIDPPMIRQAIGIHRRFELRYWDALIVASALRAKCQEILTEDLANGQDYGGVRVRNPFS